MRRYRVFLWIVPVITAILLILNWDAAAISLFPRLTLSRAVERRLHTVWEQYSRSPLYGIAELLNGEDSVTADLALTQDHGIMGNSRYSLSAVLRDSPRKFFASGWVSLAGQELDLSVYLDEDAAAIRAEQLLQEGWYGIGYDSVCADIRDNKVLSFLLGWQTLEKLEESAASLKALMDKKIPRFPVLRQEDLDYIGLGIMMLEYDLSRDILRISGEDRRVFCLSCELTGREVAAAAKSGALPQWAVALAEKMQGNGASKLEMMFILMDGELYGFSARAMVDENLYEAEVTWAGDDWNAALTVSQEGADPVLYVCFGPDHTSSEYTHEIQVIQYQQDTPEEIQSNYRWDGATGNLWLRFSDGAQVGVAHILLTEDSLRLEAAELDPILRILTREGWGLGHCILTLSPGGQVSTPDYRDFSDWSMDDLFALLEGFGGLLGIVAE